MTRPAKILLAALAVVYLATAVALGGFGGSQGAGSGGTYTGSTGITLSTADFQLDVNGLTADGSPDTAADYVATYDADAGTHKKVLLSALAVAPSTTHAEELSIENTTTSVTYRIETVVIVLATTAGASVSVTDADLGPDGSIVLHAYCKVTSAINSDIVHFNFGILTSDTNRYGDSIEDPLNSTNVAKPSSDASRALSVVGSVGTIGLTSNGAAFSQGEVTCTFLMLKMSD